MEPATRPAEVWAVEYTSASNTRVIAVMTDKEMALDWMLNLIDTSDADPVLLCSAAEFRPVDGPRRSGQSQCGLHA